MTRRSLCLTIDIDWAHDAVIADALALVERAGLPCTWFVTHRTPILDAIRAVPDQELGLHPNFNPCFSGEGGEPARDIVLALRDFVPEAVSIRSHSLTQSSRLAALFRELGLTHESNLLLPPWLGPIAPWTNFKGMIEAPVRWEDDVRLADPSFGDPVEHLALNPLVVDFHPIHLFLNTASLSDYEASRSIAADPNALLLQRRPAASGGSRDRFKALVDAAREQDVGGLRLRDIRPQGRT